MSVLIIISETDGVIPETFLARRAAIWWNYRDSLQPQGYVYTAIAPSHLSNKMHQQDAGFSVGPDAAGEELFGGKLLHGMEPAEYAPLMGELTGDDTARALLRGMGACVRGRVRECLSSTSSREREGGSSAAVRRA